MAKEKLSTPPSREVRLTDGVTYGPYEHLLFMAHNGDTAALLHSMAGVELVDELRRSQAIEQFVAMLIGQMSLKGGLIGIEDVRRSAEEWHQEEVL